MARTLTPLDELQAGALAASYAALDDYLLTILNKWHGGHITKQAHDAAERSITADMKVLSDKYQALTGESLSPFATV